MRVADLLLKMFVLLIMSITPLKSWISEGMLSDIYFLHVQFIVKMFGFEVFTAVTIGSTVFWVVTLCSSKLHGIIIPKTVFFIVKMFIKHEYLGSQNFSDSVM
jgi:hypothetical protein